MKVDDILNGWFETSDNGYIYKAYKNCRNEIEYSRFIFDNPIDVYKEAYRYARTILSTLCLGKFKISLKGDISYTDYKTINVSTKVFDEPEMSINDKIDVFLGTCLHEAAHILYSKSKELDFKENKVLHYIYNVIEDERIEQKLCDNAKGYSNFLFKNKYYHFDNVKEDFCSTFLNIMFYIIRYPKYITDELIGKHYELVMKLKDILCPFPSSSYKSLECAKKIYELIKDECDKKDGNSSDDNKNDEKNDDNQNEMNNEDSHDNNENKDSHDDNSCDSDNDSSSMDSSENSSESTSEENKMDMKEVERCLESLCDENDDIRESSVVSNEFNSLNIEDSIDNEYTTHFTNVDSADCDKESYLTHYNNIRRYIETIRRKLVLNSESFEYVHKCQKNGFLNKNKIVEAIQNVPTVYCRYGSKTSNKGNVIILIDESGSMEGYKIEKAKDMAVLIYEVLKDVRNINTYIYGHSTYTERQSNGKLKEYPLVRVYTENGKFDRFKLGNIDYRRNNIDGHVILDVAKRFFKNNKVNKTSDKTIMFVISDGVPMGNNYSGYKAINHTKECVDMVEKMGIDIMQISIDNVNSSLMFKNYVKYDNLNTFAIDFGRLIQNKILKNIKQVIN